MSDKPLPDRPLSHGPSPPGPVAWLNGRWIPAGAASVPVYDAGFVLGATVAEQLRTFRGELFEFDAHLDRLFGSLATIGVDPGLDRAGFTAIATEIVARNHPLLAPGDDLGLCLFVTPGPYGSLAPAEAAPTPTVCAHTYPLPFASWAGLYERGVWLRTTPVRQPPAECWPADLKCRSRMHYYLADKHAASQQPCARAVMQDHAGRILETATANIVLYRRNTGLITPPRDHVLPGISLAYLQRLAADVGLAWQHRELHSADVRGADEVLLTSTPYGLLPATQFDGQPIGNVRPGEVFRTLLTGWSQRVGVDIVEQARQFARR